ncbi:MAG: hypothetical protein A4S08_04035 [Proteobacteria bacterium SG_bin4]|nr:MAG: hypothetical protein A4S08_04035 [Proteobacteria bacterium SG_bin4]
MVLLIIFRVARHSGINFALLLRSIASFCSIIERQGLSAALRNGIAMYQFWIERAKSQDL